MDGDAPRRDERIHPRAGAVDVGGDPLRAAKPAIGGGAILELPDELGRASGDALDQGIVYLQRDRGRQPSRPSPIQFTARSGSPIARKIGAKGPRSLRSSNRQK